MRQLVPEFPFHNADCGGSAGTAAARQAFSFQYISFILIVLTFVVGAFARGPLLKAGAGPAAEAVPPGNPAEKIVDLTYRDLFGRGDFTLDPDKAQALLSVMQSHDVDLEATVYAQVEGESPSAMAGLRLAFARSRALMEHLAAQVPAAAVRIYVVEDGVGEDQLKVELYRARRHE